MGCNNDPKLLNSKEDAKDEPILDDSMNPQMNFIYKQLKWIGKGILGNVFLGENVISKSKVARKALEIAYFDLDQLEISISKFLQFRHPKIISYPKRRFDSNFLFLDFDYYAGGNLSQKISNAKKQNKPFGEQAICEIIKQICLGLQYLHNHSIIHLDLKPENILFEERKDESEVGNLVIADYANVYLLITSEKLLQKFNNMKLYKSPEVCAELNYDSSSDIWSLGCILHEMCSFSKAFDCKNDNDYFNLVKVDNPFIKPIPDTYSTELQRLLDKMLAKDKSKRITVEGLLTNPLINKEGYEEMMRKKQNDLRAFEQKGESIIATMEEVIDKNKKGGYPNEVKIISDLISSNSELILPRFYLTFKIGDKYAGEISKALHKNISLIEFITPSSNIGDQGLTEIAEALTNHPKIQKLDMSDNRISDKGIEQLVKMLKINSIIKDLKLDYNKIGDNGASSFAILLQTNQSLLSLSMNYNLIGNIGAKQLIESLKVNSTLKKLSLVKNVISAKVAEGFSQFRNDSRMIIV